MAYLACDEDGMEFIFENKPERVDNEWMIKNNWIDDSSIQLPSGTIEKLIGRPLTWSDEPVEI